MVQHCLLTNDILSYLFRYVVYYGYVVRCVCKTWRDNYDAMFNKCTEESCKFISDANILTNYLVTISKAPEKRFDGKQYVMFEHQIYIYRSECMIRWPHGKYELYVPLNYLDLLIGENLDISLLHHVIERCDSSLMQYFIERCLYMENYKLLLKLFDKHIYSSNNTEYHLSVSLRYLIAQNHKIIPEKYIKYYTIGYECILMHNAAHLGAIDVLQILLPPRLTNNSITFIIHGAKQGFHFDKVMSWLHGQLNSDIMLH